MTQNDLVMSVRTTATGDQARHRRTRTQNPAGGQVVSWSSGSYKDRLPEARVKLAEVRSLVREDTMFLMNLK